MRALAANISAIPNEIMAKGVPGFLVVTTPIIKPKKSPKIPPINGVSAIGIHMTLALIKFIV